MEKPDFFKLMFFDTGDLKNSAIFTRKNVFWSLFLIKLF